MPNSDPAAYEIAETNDTAGHGRALVLKYGSGSITTTGGIGTWEEVKRPYLPPLTVWRGPAESYKHKIPSMLDTFGIGQEADLDDQRALLEEFAGLALEGTPAEPPLLSLYGLGTIPNDADKHAELSWVIVGLDWGEAIRDDQTGALLRQDVAVTYMVHNDSLEALGRLEDDKVPGGYRVKNEESFEQIAKHLFKNARLGGPLAHLNSGKHGKKWIQGATSKVRAGQEIKLPSKALLRQWEQKYGR